MFAFTPADPMAFGCGTFLVPSSIRARPSSRAWARIRNRPEISSITEDVMTAATANVRTTPITTSSVACMRCGP